MVKEQNPKHHFGVGMWYGKELAAIDPVHPTLMTRGPVTQARGYRMPCSLSQLVLHRVSLQHLDILLMLTIFHSAALVFCLGFLFLFY